MVVRWAAACTTERWWSAANTSVTAAFVPQAGLAAVQTRQKQRYDAAPRTSSLWAVAATEPGNERRSAPASAWLHGRMTLLLLPAPGPPPPLGASAQAKSWNALRRRRKPPDSRRLLPGPADSSAPLLPSTAAPSGLAAAAPPRGLAGCGVLGRAAANSARTGMGKGVCVHDQWVCRV
jgi:hypothetical protein